MSEATEVETFDLWANSGNGLKRLLVVASSQGPTKLVNIRAAFWFLVFWLLLLIIHFEWILFIWNYKMQYALRLNKIILFCLVGSSGPCANNWREHYCRWNPLSLYKANFIKKVIVDAQLSRLSSVFDSCFLCSIVFPWSKDSQCRTYGGKGGVVFVVAKNWMRYELLSLITSTNSYV